MGGAGCIRYINAIKKGRYHSDCIFQPLDSMRVAPSLSPFHGGNGGSNPPGDSIYSDGLA